MATNIITSRQQEALVPNVPKSSNKSSRLIRRFLHYLKLKQEGNLILKSFSTLISETGKPFLYKRSLEPMRMTAATLVVEKSPVEMLEPCPDKIRPDTGKPYLWPSKENSLPDRYAFDEVWDKFQAGLVPKVRLSSGAEVYMTTPLEFSTYWDKLYWPHPFDIIRGWVHKEESVGLPGGGRERNTNKPSEGRRTRNRRKGNKRRTERKMNIVKQEGSINMMQPPDRTYPCLVRYNGTLTADGSGVASAKFSIRNPTLAYNGSGTYNDVVDFASLFDEYKPVYWVMQYIPLFAVGSAASGSLVMCVDYDAENSAPIPNYSNIMQYREFKILDSRKPFEFKAKIPILTEGTYGSTGADPEPAIIHKGGFLDYNKPPNEGTAYLGGLGLPPMSTFATFVLTLLLINRRQR